MSTIMVIGSFSGWNFGDSAVLAATLSGIDRHLGRDTRYLIPTVNPGFVARHFDGGRVSPVDIHLRRTKSFLFLSRSVIRALGDADAVVTTAGIFFDFRLLDPRFNFVLSLGPILRRARRRGIPVVGLNVGITSPHSAIGSVAVGRAVSAHDHMAARDRASYELAKRWLGEERVSSGADSVHSYCEPSIVERGAGLLGVNAAAYLNRFAASRRRIARTTFVSRFGASLDRVAAEHSLRVRFLATTPADHQLHEEVAGRMQGQSELRELSRGPVRDGMAAFSGLDFMLGTRLHTCIIATTLGVPTIGVPYHPKVADYLGDLGLSRWVLPIEACMTEELDVCMRELAGEQDNVRTTLEQALPGRAALAEEAFETLARLVRGSAPVDDQDG